MKFVPFLYKNLMSANRGFDFIFMKLLRNLPVEGALFIFLFVRLLILLFF